MKSIYFIFSILIITSSCKEEDLPVDLNEPSFTCNIDGNNFSSSSFSASVNDFDMLSMNFGDGVYTMDFRIYNFSTINTDQIVYFSVPSMGTVSYQGNAYTNSYNPPYDGELVFTEINDGKLSGTLHFKAQDVDPASFVNMNVTNGLFSNIDY